MAFKLLSLALVSAVVAQCGLADTGAELKDTIAVPVPPPAFCKGLDCPIYKVLNTTATYEVREYEPSAWVKLMGGCTFAEPSGPPRNPNRAARVGSSRSAQSSVPLTPFSE